MTDLEIYRHFCRYVDTVNEDGTCFVSRTDYDNFVIKLPLKSSEKGFPAYVTSYGHLAFKIDDVSHFFDDFETFKKNFMEEYGV